MILAPCGGGSLLSGTGVAVKNIRPECQVIGVETLEAATSMAVETRSTVLLSYSSP